MTGAAKADRIQGELSLQGRVRGRRRGVRQAAHDFQPGAGQLCGDAPRQARPRVLTLRGGVYDVRTPTPSGARGA